jgi:hypothetical protein
MEARENIVAARPDDREPATKPLQTYLVACSPKVMPRRCERLASAKSDRGSCSGGFRPTAIRGQKENHHTSETLNRVESRSPPLHQSGRTMLIRRTLGLPSVCTRRSLHVRSSESAPPGIGGRTPIRRSFRRPCPYCPQHLWCGLSPTGNRSAPWRTGSLARQRGDCIRRAQPRALSTASLRRPRDVVRISWVSQTQIIIRLSLSAM